MNDPTKCDLPYKIIHISSSLFISFIFIWVVGYFFCNSLHYYQYDLKLKKFISAPVGKFQKWRTEGIASTYIGKFGINAIKNITNDNREKIAIYGDSYVEAYQVSDKYKMPQIVTTELQAQGRKGILSFGIGMSGDSVADYYFDIPKYESIVNNIKYHVIIFTHIKEILPNLSKDNRGHFQTSPLNLYHDQWTPSPFGLDKKWRLKTILIKSLLNKFRLYFIWDLTKLLVRAIQNINFMPTIKKPTKILDSDQIAYSNKFLSVSWEFLLSELTKQTSHSIIFVYCPNVPKIQNNKIVSIDRNLKQIGLFTRIARKHNIAILDASNSFINFYNTTGLFPRGFPNSKPSQGHFNKYGHKIVAKIITNYVCKTGNI